MSWIIDHWDSLLSILAAFHAFALTIVNVTDTPKDDEILAKIYRYVELFAGLFTDKAKDTGA